MLVVNFDVSPAPDTVEASLFEFLKVVGVRPPALQRWVTRAVVLLQST